MANASLKKTQSKLGVLLTRLRESTGFEPYNIRLIRDHILLIFKRKWKKNKEFEEKVKALWTVFEEENEARRWKRDYIIFFKDHFNEIFRFYIQAFFGLQERKLVFIRTSQVVDEEILFEFEYFFTDEELNDIRDYRNQVKLEESLAQIIVFLFYYVCLTLGKYVHSYIPEDFYISQVCGNLKSSKSKPHLNFLVSIRKPRMELLYQYGLSTLYHYIQPIREIPNEIKDNLHSGVDLIYEKAESHYPRASVILAGVLNNFFNRCTVLEQVTPILDLVNFICARVEDSIFDTMDVLLRGFLPKFSFSSEKKRAFADIFDFVNKAASLSATFQSNNRPTKIKQFQLFTIICQYYFQGEILTDPEKSPLFFPQVFQRNVKKFLDDGSIELDTFATFEQFIISAFMIARSPSIDLFFQIVFGTDIETMNENFLSSFRRSLNERVLDLIAEKDIEIKRLGVDDYLSFKQVMDLICRFLYFLVKTIFMTENSAERSSQNFRDRLSRYRPQGIKLRVLEMELFREIPLSDNVWGEFLRSVFREKIESSLSKYHTFSDDEFFTPRRLVHLDMIYSQGAISDAPLVADWLLTDVLIPFSRNARVLSSGREKSAEEIYNFLVNHELTPKDEQVYEDLEEIAFTLAELFARPMPVPRKELVDNDK